MFWFCRVLSLYFLITLFFEATAAAGTMRYAFDEDSSSAFTYFNNDSGWLVVGRVSGDFTVTDGTDGALVLHFKGARLGATHFVFLASDDASRAELPPTDPRSIFADSFAHQPLGEVVPGADMLLTSTHRSSTKIDFGPKLTPSQLYRIEFSLLDTGEGLRLIGGSRIQADDGDDFSIDAAVVLVPEPASAVLVSLIVGAVLISAKSETTRPSPRTVDGF